MVLLLLQLNGYWELLWRARIFYIPQSREARWAERFPWASTDDARLACFSYFLEQGLMEDRKLSQRGTHQGVIDSGNCF